VTETTGEESLPELISKSIFESISAESRQDESINAITRISKGIRKNIFFITNTAIIKKFVIRPIRELFTANKNE